MQGSGSMHGVADQHDSLWYARGGRGVFEVCVLARVLTYRHSEAQLAQDSGLPPDIVREGLKQFQALYLQGDMPLSSNAGVESQGIGTVTILVQGGKLCILADVSETMAFFGMEAVGETIQKFTELKEVPDTFALPSLSAVYLKTGDWCFHGAFCASRRT